MRGTREGMAAAPKWIGASRAITEVMQLTDAVAESDCSVLIEGESGTGKELVARRLHASSPRSAKPFIPVNCAGVNETVFESQFFGHVRGAFTGAEQTMLGMVRSADSGTLFLDEIGEIPLNLQPKLLRVLQEGEVMPVGLAAPVRVDTRFIAATNRDLREEVRRGRFREDLYYRLNVVTIELPPLRQRAEDIPLLLEHFNSLCAARYERDEIVLSEHVRSRLMNHRWPGNVRELAAWIERLYATKLPAELLVKSLGSDLRGETSQPGEVQSLQQAERLAIKRAMLATDNNQQAAAELLQIHRCTLRRKLRDIQFA